MKSIPKPLDRVESRDALDALVNAESMNMIDAMVAHRQITMDDMPEDTVVSEKDILDIDMAFLVQEIAGIKVLMRGDLAKTRVEYQEVTRDEITP